MIDIQPHLDKLDKLTEWINAFIEIKAWMCNVFKPIPWDAFNVLHNSPIKFSK